MFYEKKRSKTGEWVVDVVIISNIYHINMYKFSAAG